MTKTSNNTHRVLNDMEIEAVSGAITVALASQISLSVEDAKRIEQAQRLKEAYSLSRPFDFYGYFG
jgi:hypothetical protein